VSVSFARRWSRRLLPHPVRSAVSRALGLRPDLGGILSRIDAKGAWRRAEGAFYSGDGSHDPLLVVPYVNAVRGWLEPRERPVRIVDRCEVPSYGGVIRTVVHSFR
jgi:hypothetical protein